MLTLAGLQKFADGDGYLAELKTTLEKTYQAVNGRFGEGDNSYLTVDDSGYAKVSTPDRQDMLEGITGGSIIAWAHVNMQGEYDFTRPAANDDVFDMPSILALKLG